MTSEPDSTERRRPPTIDLKATEVETEKQPPRDAGEKEPPPPGAGGSGTAGAEPADSRDRPWLQSAHLIGAGVGIVAMLAIFSGLWLAGLLPSRGGAPANVSAPAPAVSTETMKENSARLDKIEAALAARPSGQSLNARLAATAAETKVLDSSLAALTHRLDDIALTAHTALARADTAAAAAAASKDAAAAAVASKNAAQAGAERNVQALSDRIAALATAQQALAAEITHRSVDDRAARRTIATEALRSAVERGAPYAAELVAVKSLGAKDDDLAALTPFATDGVPSAPTLAHELQMLTPALLQASGTAPRQNTFLSRLEVHAQKLVRVTPINAPAGDDAEAVIARSEADAAHGDLAAATAEIAHLPDAARALAAPWVKKAQAREAAIAASRHVAAAALAALDTPAKPSAKP